MGSAMRLGDTKVNNKHELGKVEEVIMMVQLGCYKIHNVQDVSEETLASTRYFPSQMRGVLRWKPNRHWLNRSLMGHQGEAPRSSFSVVITPLLLLLHSIHSTHGFTSLIS